MKMEPSEVHQLRTAFSICRIAGIDSVVVTDNQVRGVSPSSKMAILSPLDMSFDKDIKIGFGRLSEFEKRLSIFSTETLIDCKVNDKNEVSLMTLSSSKAKVQFRCTSEHLIKYPKSNDDDLMVTVVATKDEITQLSRAVKMLGAPTLTISISRDLSVKFECSSETNEVFTSSLTNDAVFEDISEPVLFVYEGDKFATVLDAAAKDVDEVILSIGAFGSLMLTIKGITILALPESNQETDDE